MIGEMMKNSVQVSLVFYFKGEKFNPQIELDLDTYFLKKYDIKSIYDLLAKHIGLDAYRHEYDVMVLEHLVYTEPTGIAEAFVHDEEIDWAGLMDAYKKAEEHKAIQALAQTHFSEEELEANPKLLAAMMDVYKKSNKA